MKLDSSECKKLLNEYQVNTDLEKLAIKVLLTNDSEVLNIPEISKMTDTQIDELSVVIKDIRIKNNIDL